MVTDVIRDAVLRSELTRYEIAKRSGIDQAALLRFVRGGSLRIESLEKLCPVLGLELAVTAVAAERKPPRVRAARVTRDRRSKR
jgi:transcriptional regulator with XRE-family HTH domain